MSFMEHPQPDACRALMPTPEPPLPGPPSRPMVCHMPKGHDGPHAITRHPRTLDRRWEGDARPPATPPVPVTAVDVDALDKLREALAEALCNHHGGPGWWTTTDDEERDSYRDDADALLPVVDRIANERAAAELRAAADDLATVPGNPYPLVVSEFLNGRADDLDPT